MEKFSYLAFITSGFHAPTLSILSFNCDTFPLKVAHFDMQECDPGWKQISSPYLFSAPHFPRSLCPLCTCIFTKMILRTVMEDF